MDEMERHKELLEIIKPPTKEQLEKAEERHEFLSRLRNVVWTKEEVSWGK